AGDPSDQQEQRHIQGQRGDLCHVGERRQITGEAHRQGGKSVRLLRRVMMATYVSHVRNVNEAFAELMRLAGNPSIWRKVSPRGMETLEFRGTFITEYSHPQERVLFSAVRDANPFFHFMESLWIMAGR